ncbi:MAG: hypothetical protein ACYDCL_17035 [Myxococcales bacterium]
MDPQTDGAEGFSRARRLAADARALLDDVEQTRGWLAHEARARVDASPWAMLAGAAFMGYVLGGGLSAPLTRQMFRLGLRLAIGPLLQGGLGIGEASRPVEVRH